MITSCCSLLGGICALFVVCCLVCVVCYVLLVVDSFLKRIACMFVCVLTVVVWRPTFDVCCLRVVVRCGQRVLRCWLFCVHVFVFLFVVYMCVVHCLLIGVCRPVGD